MTSHREAYERDQAALQREFERVERRLAARGRVEKALFDEGPWTLVMMLIPAAVLTIELAANAARGSGWSSIAHFVVMTPLALLLLVYIGLGVRSMLWRIRLNRLARRRGDVP